jgi:hypothetical protein
VPTCERVPERSRGLVGGTHVQMCPRTKRDVMQGTRTGGGEERGKKRRERYLGVGCRENTEGGNVLGKEEEQSAVRVVYFLARGRGWVGGNWNALRAVLVVGGGGGISVHLTSPEQQKQGRIVRGHREIQRSCVHALVRRTNRLSSVTRWADEGRHDHWGATGVGAGGDALLITWPRVWGNKASWMKPMVMDSSGADGGEMARRAWKVVEGQRTATRGWGMSGMEILASLSIDSMVSGGGRFTSLGRSS